MLIIKQIISKCSRDLVRTASAERASAPFRLCKRRTAAKREEEEDGFAEETLKCVCATCDL